MRLTMSLPSQMLALSVALLACGNDSTNEPARSKSPATGTSNPPESESPRSDASVTGPDAGKSEAGGDARDAGTPDHPVPDGDDAMMTFQSLCEESCSQQADCVGVSRSQCEDQCLNRAASLESHQCLAEAAAEMACLKELSCDDLKAYVEKGRRRHPVCGSTATAYFARCTIWGGEIPPACESTCARQEGCGLLMSSAREACEESCTLRATAADFSQGSACSSAFLDVARCLALSSCDEVGTLLETGVVPEGCTAQDAERARACM